GKSRLVQVLKEHVASEPQAWLTPCQCSPYYRNSALYPLIDLLERVALQFDREETPPQKLSKLEGFVVQYGLPLVAAVPLFAALAAAPGRRDDRSGGARQGTTSRGGRAGGGQDRWGAAVCGGVDQDGAGVGAAPGGGGTL